QLPVRHVTLGHLPIGVEGELAGQAPGQEPQDRLEREPTARVAIDEAVAKEHPQRVQLGAPTDRRLARRKRVFGKDETASLVGITALQFLTDAPYDVCPVLHARSCAAVALPSRVAAARAARSAGYCSAGITRISAALVHGLPFTSDLATSLTKAASF